MRRKLLVIGMVITTVVCVSAGCSKEKSTNKNESTIEKDADATKGDASVNDEAEVNDDSGLTVSEADKFIYTETEGGIKIVSYDGEADIINIPENINGLKVVKIYDNAFYNNDNIKQVVISDTVKEIGESAFDSCSSLETVDLGEGVEHIDNYAFAGCERLNNVLIPESVTERGYSIFWGCTSLSNVTDNSSVTVLEGGDFSSTAVKEYVVPDGVTKIEMNEFRGCDDIVVTIPESVTEMHEYVFGDDDKAENVTIKGAAGSYAETFAKENGITFEAR